MGKSTQTKIGYLIRDGVETREIIWIKDENRERGSYVLGLSGTGKSSFYQTIILQDLLKDYPTIVIDPHGDLVNHLIAQLPNDENILSRVFLLDLTDEDFPFPLNVFTCANPADSRERTRTRNRVLKVFEKLWPEVASSVLFDKLMPNVVETLIDNQGMTLRDIRRLLHDAEYRKSKIRNLHNGEVWDFWQYEYKEKETEVLDNRLRKFLIDPVIRHITCHPDGTINLRRAIEEKQIVLVKLPTNVPEYQISAPIIGTMLLSLIVGVTFSFDDTAKQERPGYSLFVDEVENFVTDDFDTIFNQGRKYRPRLLIANQYLNQLSPKMQESAIGANSVISFQTNKNDARGMAPIFFDEDMAPRPDPIYRDVIKRLPNYQNKNNNEYYAVKRFYERYIQVLQGEYKREPIVDKTGFELPIDYNFGYDLGGYWGGGKETVRLDIELTLKAIEHFLYEAQVNGQVSESYRDYVMGNASRFFGFLSYEQFHPNEKYRRYLRGEQTIEQTLSWIKDDIAETQQRFVEKNATIEQNITTLKSFLIGDALYIYLYEYYTYFYSEQTNRPLHEPIPETILLHEEAFWHKAIASVQQERNVSLLISSAKMFLKDQAKEYARLENRASVDKIMQQEMSKKGLDMRSKYKQQVEDYAQYKLEGKYKEEKSNDYGRFIKIRDRLKEIYNIKAWSYPDANYTSSQRDFYKGWARTHGDEWHRSQWPLTWDKKYHEAEPSFLSLKEYTLDLTMDNLPYVLRGLPSNKTNYEEVKECWKEKVVLYHQIEVFAHEYPTLEAFKQKNQALYRKLQEETIDRYISEVQNALLRDNPAFLEEAKRNAELCSINTPGKLLDIRTAELNRYRAILERQKESYLEQYRKEIESHEWRYADLKKDLEKEKKNYDAFFNNLMETTNALITHPIGDEKPYRESDVARILIDLPKRHAFIKVSGEKDGDPPRKLQMKTLDAPQATVRGQALEDRIQRIRDQTHTRYCRPVAEVEAALRGERTGDPQNKENAYQPNTIELPEEERPTRRKRLTSEDETV